MTQDGKSKYAGSGCVPRMKVAIVAPYWFPVRGGPTTYASELAAELRHQGHEVQIVVRKGGDRGATVVDAPGFAFARRAAGELESFRPEAVHAHAHWYALAAALRYRRAHPASRVVFTLHTPFPRRSFWRRFAFRRMMSRADFVTGVSADLLGRTLRTYRPRARTRVTWPGVAVKPSLPGDLDEFRRRFGLEGRGPLIGYLGRLSWEGKVRGLERLIHAMSLVRRSVPTATLIVGGDGPHRARLEALADAEVPGGVLFLGDIPDPAPHFFNTAIVYAHISEQEGLPIALLEAMACDRVIVASATGGIPEAIRHGENGFLVSSEPAEVAARIVEVLRSPDLRDRFVRAAREDVAARFTWPRAVDRLLPLFGVPTRHRVVVTVDLEVDYHAPGGSVRGLEEGLPKLLELFGRHGIRATVFATADLCVRHSSVIREVVSRGHELGCHGQSHDVEYMSGRSLDWQRETIRGATDALEKAAGVRPKGFRAPNFSADGDTIRVLEELGYRYDSSVLPGRVVRGMRVVRRLDFRVAPRDPYRPSREDPALPGDARIWELPVAENPRSPGGPIGLGYVNAFGVEATLDAVAGSAADPCIFLIHPWELVDPPPGKVPRWMHTACTSDPTKLDEFLGRLRREHDLTDLGAVIARLR